MKATSIQDTINNIYATKTVRGRSGKTHALHSAIDPQEGSFLANIILDDPSITKTLEVGCAYGLSALHICSAIKDREGASHTIIDPFQNPEWDGAGIKNLQEAGIDFFNLIEMKSEFASPRLACWKKGKASMILFLSMVGTPLITPYLIVFTLPGCYG